MHERPPIISIIKFQWSEIDFPDQRQVLQPEVSILIFAPKNDNKKENFIKYNISNNMK